jgi:pimeloyl-ACP methyl ester carboxylesterase
MSRDSSVAPKGEGTLNIRGVEISFEVLGDGRSGGCPLVLTPGGGGGKGGLRWLAQRLRGGRQCLIWDRPNCGASGLTLGDDLRQPEPDMQARAVTARPRGGSQRCALTLPCRCLCPRPPGGLPA